MKYQQKYFLSVGTDVALVVPNSDICTSDTFLYGDLHMKGLVYTQCRQNIRSFCLPWVGWPQYLDQNNQLISSIQLFYLLK